METDSQSKALLEGDDEVPQSVVVKSFLRTRLNEIEALTQLIDTPSNNIFLKKLFPKHMRRRAMSQNVKRIPKRIREHQADMREKSGVKEVPIKRPSRKYRRRPKNLLSEYNRRQKQFAWLETHIWHAKRFQMVEKWGYKVPLCSNDKSYRACYRATTKHCLIQDISFNCCIELRGPCHEIVEGLRNHTSPDCGHTTAAVYRQSGKSEGVVMFFASGKYPFGAIGDINFIWQPTDSTTVTKVLWLWCHPSYYLEVLDELIKTFAFELEMKGEGSLDSFEKNIDEPMEQESSEEPNQKNVEARKLEMKNIPFERTPKYYSKTSSVRMVLLKDTLNRFRLTGPLSQELITSVFKGIDLSNRTVNDWCCKFKNRKEINIQLEFLEKLKNVYDPDQLPRNLVFGLIAVDPRFTMPAYGDKVKEGNTDVSRQSIITPEEGLWFSPIWSSEVRDEVTTNKLSDHQLNGLRSNQLISGVKAEMDNFPAIPCLFIQRPGTFTDGKPLGYSSGWDIIVPAGYGQPVWVGLIKHGGRAGGLKETISVMREAGKLYLAPDTSAGKLEQESRRNEQTDKYFRLPPAKRPNYIKLGFPTPFHCPWNILINDWMNGEKETLFVLRHRKTLLNLQKKLKNIKDKLDFEQTETSALIGVMVTLVGKGNIENNSYICIPSEADLQRLKDNRKFCGPIEEKHCDKLDERRKVMLQQHQKEIKSLSRKRQKDRKHGKKIDDSSKSSAIVAEHNDAMKQLWLPECTTIKDSGSRSVMGFVTDGDFSFTVARSCGVGYICFKGFLTFIELVERFEKNRFVLVRSANTNQYRFARLAIVRTQYC